MNKKMLALPLMAILFAIPAVSMAQSYGGGYNDYGSWFLSGQVGESRLQSTIASQNTATSSALMAGYRWNLNPMFQFGGEVGYATTGTFKDSINGTTAKAKADGFLAGVTGKLNFTPNWYFSFEGGYFDAKQTTSGTTYVGTTLVSYGQHHTMGSFYTGVGIGYDFNQNMSLGLNYDNFQDNDNQVNLTSNVTALRFEVRF